MQREERSQYIKVTRALVLVIGLHLLMWLALEQKQSRLANPLSGNEMKRINVQWIFLRPKEQMQPQTTSEFFAKNPQPITLAPTSVKFLENKIVTKSPRKTAEVVKSNDERTEENSNLQATLSKNPTSNPERVALPGVEEMKSFAVRDIQGFKSRRQLESVGTLSQTEKFGREVEKGKRQNCQTSHAHLGLLAPPFLIKDTLTDTGCKW